MAVRARQVLVSAEVPNEFESHEQYERFCHRDLADLTGVELWGEGQKARHGIAFARDPDDGAWFSARLRAVRAEHARRARGF